jgi:hypothetical protein
MEGYGTDVYITLNRLGDHTVQDHVVGGQRMGWKPENTAALRDSRDDFRENEWSSRMGKVMTGYRGQKDEETGHILTRRRPGAV